MVSFGAQVDFQVPHIRIKNLNKYYRVHDQDVHALKAINLDIPQGKIFGIIGKSGAGKSSLLRTLNGLESISSGSIHIHHDELSTLSHAQLIQMRQKVGMIFQHFNLMSAKTVWENVALPLKIAHYPKQEIEQRVTEVLKLVGLEEKQQHYPSQLSGGQKQRVGIARALVHHPEILLCDEATSALDPESTAAILTLLKQINQKLGLTIVLITHEMQVIREICDHVVVIDQGEIVESGAVWSVFAHPQQKITQELLSFEQIDLPFVLEKQYKAAHQQIVLKLNYAAQSANPIHLNDFFAHFKEAVYLHQSHVDHIQAHLVGFFVVSVANPKLDLVALSEQLKPFISRIEVLGYV